MGRIGLLFVLGLVGRDALVNGDVLADAEGKISSLLIGSRSESESTIWSSSFFFFFGLSIVQGVVSASKDEG